MINGDVVMDNDNRRPNGKSSMWCPGKTPKRRRNSQEPVVKRNLSKRDEEKDEVGGSSDRDGQWAKLRSEEVKVINAACLEKEAKHRMPTAVGMVGNQEVEVMRDTGCLGVIVK